MLLGEMGTLFTITSIVHDKLDPNYVWSWELRIVRPDGKGAYLIDGLLVDAATLRSNGPAQQNPGRLLD